MAEKGIECSVSLRVLLSIGLQELLFRGAFLGVTFSADVRRLQNRLQFYVQPPSTLDKGLLSEVISLILE